MYIIILRYIYIYLQVFVLCWANGLYDAILHVYNRGMQDYITPLQELLSLLSDAVNSGKQLDEKQVRIHLYYIFFTIINHLIII